MTARLQSRTLSGLLLAGLILVSMGCGSDDGPVSAGSTRTEPTDADDFYADAAQDVGSESDTNSDRGLPADRLLREGAVGILSLVLDGDTVHVDVDGWYNTVRVQGINTPECEFEARSTSEGSQFVCVSDQEFWGLNAADALRDFAEGQQVTVRCETTDGEECPQDGFDRYLAFLELSDGRDIGEFLTRNGHAFSFTAFASSHRAIYCAAEDAAIDEELGMWGTGSRESVLNQMNESTQSWYQNRDSICGNSD